MKVGLANSSFFAVMVAVWLVTAAGFVIAKSSLQELTIDRVKHTAELRAQLYKQIWDGALDNELSQLQTIASFPAVVQGVMQPETHLEALRHTIEDSLRKKTSVTAIAVDFEGNRLFEFNVDNSLPDIPTDELVDVLNGSRAFDIQFLPYGDSLIAQFIVPISRQAQHEDLVEGAIVMREPIEDIHNQTMHSRQPTDGRLVLTDGNRELFSIGSEQNNYQSAIDVAVAMTQYRLRYFPQVGLEKSLLNERLYGLAASFVLALTVCLGVGYLLVDRLLKHPLSIFMEAIENGANSGTAVPIKQGSRFNEIRRLTDRYNDMMLEISNRQEELRNLNQSLHEMVVTQSKELAAMQTQNAKMDFLSSVSHELRTPLHGMLGFTRLGLEKCESDGQTTVARYFRKVERNANTLLSLVDDVLHLTKSQDNFDSDNMTDAKAVELVKRVVEDMEVIIAEASIEVRVIEKEPDLVICVDTIRIEQVVRNLLSNAIRYSNANSMVDIEILREGSYCEIRVLDKGVGIPPDELESIFDAFTQSSRTDKLAGGTGLGLAISRAIVSNHQGRIKAENRHYGGACFSFTLPISISKAVAA